MSLKEIKKGVLVYKPGYGRQNIGDYIQSLAALQFLGKYADTYMHREHLNEYTGENVALIMNGWFTHHPENWPPAKSIIPLFVSFHINSLAKDRLLSENGIKYLKQHEPIGCRDKKTVELLQNKGVNAYFTGCLTLTLGESYTSNKKSGKIYFVDPHFNFRKTFSAIKDSMLTLIGNYSKISKLAPKIIKIAPYLTNPTSLKSLLFTASFYRTYSEIFDDNILFDAEYIHHYFSETSFKNEEEKFDLAKSLLSKYAEADLVVTSRIHCALPSLGLGTPVIYVNDCAQDEASYCRLDGIVDLFNVIDYKNGKLHSKFSWGSGKINKKTKLSNQTGYLGIKAKLVEKCKNFAHDLRLTGVE